MVIESIFEHGRRTPGRIAVHFGDLKVSYRDLAGWILRARRYLMGQGLREGSVAILNLDSLLDGWVIGFALRSLGLTTLSVRSLDLLDSLAIPDIGCVITTIHNSSARADAGNQNYRHIQMPLHPYLGRRIEGDCELPHPALPMGGHILLTSGTTGTSKKVLVDDAGHRAMVRNRAVVYGITENSVVDVFNFPRWTALGYGVPSAAWSLGASVVLHHGPGAHKSLLVEGATHAFFNPATMRDLLNEAIDDRIYNDALELFVVGGLLPRALADAAKERLSPHLFTVIGSTEVGAWTRTRIDGPDDLRWHRIHPSMEVQVVDRENKPLPAGKSGFVRVRVTGHNAGYLGDEEASREFFRHGYFYTGDLGTFRTDGRLVLDGRSTSVINAMGIKLAAEPIEQALQDRLSAIAVCVLSMQGNGTDEELHVAIQADRPIGKADLASAIGAEISGFPHAHIHLVANIPRNDLGKIDRAALRRQLLAALADRGSPDEAG